MVAVRENCHVEERGDLVGATSGGEAEREAYLRYALQAFESGSIDAYQYTQRVQAIGSAGSVTEMAEALQGRGLSPGAGPSRPPMDAVDLALMKVSTSPRRSAKSKRYRALILVALVFIVLLGIGVWLSTRVHTVTPSPNGATRDYISVSGVPPSLLSPRR